jgi:glycosyltransferase involved in cell wall biosynthesis
MRKPKVCIFTETYYPVVGGGESQARALAEGLVARGFDVLVLTRRSDAAFPKVESFGEITVHRLPPVGQGHIKKWGLLLSGFMALVRLRRQYDLIFVSGFRAVGPAAVWASGLFGKGCVLKADSSGETSGDFFAAGLAKLPLKPPAFVIGVMLRLRNRVLRRADAFVAICSDIEAELLADGVRPGSIRRIPNSVDTDTFHPVDRQRVEELRSKLHILPKKTIVAYTGRLVSYKGLPLLLRVWKEIHSRYPDAGLLLVGSGGLDLHNCESELREYVRKNDLEGSVQFSGAVHNVQEYLQASDIFVLPSESEGLSLSLIEAMACGLPVVSTPVGGNKDILTHGQDGLVVDAGDFQQLLQVLETLITDPALGSQLGAAARRTAVERYSADAVMEQYTTLFSGARGPGGRPTAQRETAGAREAGNVAS